MNDLAQAQLIRPAVAHNAGKQKKCHKKAAPAAEKPKPKPKPKQTHASKSQYELENEAYRTVKPARKGTPCAWAPASFSSVTGSNSVPSHLPRKKSQHSVVSSIPYDDSSEEEKGKKKKHQAVDKRRLTAERKH
jgi:hypothetical protein